VRIIAPISKIGSRNLQDRDAGTGVHDGGIAPLPFDGGATEAQVPYITASWVISGTPESGEITGVFPPALSKEGNGGGGAFS